MADEKKQNQLLETTDCLEAIGTLKSIKNIFFFLIFICLLVLQGLFWLMSTDYVNRPGQLNKAETTPVIAALTQLAAKTEVAVETKTEKIEKAAQALAGDPNAIAADPNTAEAKQIRQINIDFAHISKLLRCCNYLLAICAVLYSMTLVFAMKVSLVGRLGGISHITKAVFVSFIIVVIILPWQLLFKGVLVGVIYTPAELLCAWDNFDRAALGATSMMFLRFCGLWLFALVLLFSAQLRSGRWAKNTLKRLGIAG